MSLASLSPQSAGVGSPINSGRTPGQGTFDPQELESKLKVFRELTPIEEESVERFKEEAQRDYNQLIALGGRPTRPIQQYPSWKAYVVDDMVHYREEYEKIEVICEMDERRAASHWADEGSHWDDELWRWEKFKEAQRIRSEGGRSELDLELENTDVALVGALSKLNDWQEFQSMLQKKVHQAEYFYENCQQGVARSQKVMVPFSILDKVLADQEPVGGWMSNTMKAEKQLEASRSELMWAQSQWRDVIVEACASIVAAPKLQKELEAKFEKQAKAMHRNLRQMEVRPSHAIHPPDVNAEFPRRIQHWISETSNLAAELWDRKVILEWRRAVKKFDTPTEEEQKQPLKADLCSELLEYSVKYHQHELDKAISWVNCWRREARQYREAKKQRRRRHWPFSDSNEKDDQDDYDEDDGDDEDGFSEAKQADIYATQAEEKVLIAAKRLEQSKQNLQRIFAEVGPSSTGGISAEHYEAQPPPTPPKSQSPESLPKTRRPSEKKTPAGKGHRRSKKKARKGEAKPSNTSTAQQPLPLFSEISDHIKEDDDIEMPDNLKDPSPFQINEESNHAHSEDTNMSDIEDPPTQTPLSPPASRPTSTQNTTLKKGPSPSSQGPTSRKTRSATKPDQVPSGRILKNSRKKKPSPKEKVFTEQQTTALLDAASTGGPPNQTPLSPPNSQPTPTKNTKSKKGPSPSSQGPPSRKTRSATKPDQVPSGRILKNSRNKKPSPKEKVFTEQQTTALLDAASTGCPPAGPTTLRRSERLKVKAAGSKGRMCI